MGGPSNDGQRAKGTGTSPVVSLYVDISCVEPWGWQIFRDHHALKKGLGVTLGAETKGEVWPLNTRAGGSVSGHPNLNGGELGEDLKKGGKKDKERERGRNHPFGVRKCSFRRNGTIVPGPK